MRIFTKKRLLDIVSVIVGGFIWSVSINVFSKPNLLAPGGFTGLATVINHFFNFIPIGIGIFVLNIPLFIIMWKRSDRHFFFSTAAAMAATAVIIDLTALFLPVYTGDKLLAAIFGGVLSGIGLGIIYLRGIVTGGVDLLARMVEKHFGFLSYGKMIICLDFIVITIAAVAFQNIEVALNSAVIVYISGLVVDKLLNGAESAKLVFIISPDYQRIQKEILGILHRGVTILDAQGGYTGTDKPVILAVCRPYELIKVKKIIYSVDKQAFVIVSAASEVTGHGFSEVKNSII